MSAKNPFADPSVAAAASSSAMSPAAKLQTLDMDFNLAATSPSSQKAPPSAQFTQNTNVPAANHSGGASTNNAGIYSHHGAPAPQPGDYKAPQQNLMEEVGNSIKATEKSLILRAMRVINVLLALLNIFTGVFSWFNGYASNFQKVIASVYVILFGGLLLSFELRNDKLDKTIQNLFGFMYGYRTRTVFLIFVAIWPLSIGAHALTITTSILMFGNAFFNLFVVYNHPAFAGAPVDELNQGQQQNTV